MLSSDRDLYQVCPLRKCRCQLLGNERGVCQIESWDISPVLIVSRGLLDVENMVFVLCFLWSPFLFLQFSEFDRLLLNHRIVFISICVLHSFLCLRKCYVDISDCQMSVVGRGIIKWRHDYKALTVLYWSPPLCVVKRGISSAEALEMMNKKPHSCVSPPIFLHVRSCDISSRLPLNSFIFVLLRSVMPSLFLCCRYLLSPFTFLQLPPLPLSVLYTFFC